MPTWLITGCSTGLGRHLAKAVLQRGMNAVVTSRDVSQVQDIVVDHKDAALALSLDVTNPQQVKDAVSEAARRFGAIDVLVNNAGYGYRAAVEEADEGDVDQLFATNFFGTVRMIKTVLPGMRARRSGTIINVSSIAGRRAMPGSAYYAASKFAIGGMSDGLRKEMAPLGIRVMVIEPGAFRTDFSGRSLQQSATRICRLRRYRGSSAKGERHQSWPSTWRPRASREDHYRCRRGGGSAVSAIARAGCRQNRSRRAGFPDGRIGGLAAIRRRDRFPERSLNSELKPKGRARMRSFVEKRTRAIWSSTILLMTGIRALVKNMGLMSLGVRSA
jgi:NAD(P)-dependent dehydrogenase (short-subunit alcohol dehydrogenase family)